MSLWGRVRWRKRMAPSLLGRSQPSFSHLVPAAPPPSVDNDVGWGPHEKTLSTFQRSWSRLVLNCVQPFAIARVLSQLPDDALQDAAIWGSIINVFKRHRTLGGVTWALNEVRERRVSLRDHGCVIAANALSAFGFLGVPHRILDLLQNDPELRDCSGIEKGTLCSIAAVALARCGVECSEVVGDALQELEDADPLSAEVELAWGRCMRAYQLLGNLDGMRNLLMEHDWVFRRKGQNLRSAEHRALYIHSARLANCMIRAYGDVGDIDKAKEIYSIAKAGRHSTADGDVDLTRAHFRTLGLGPTLEWLSKNVDPRKRSAAYVWLMDELLTNGRASEAEVLYCILSTGDVDTSAFMGEQGISESQMRERVRLQLRRPHRLYARGGDQTTQHPLIEWSEVLCHVNEVALFERLMQYGSDAIPTHRVGVVLAKCVQLSSATGVALLVSHIAREQRHSFNFWDAPLGVAVMQALYDILLKPVSAEQRSAVTRVAADLFNTYPVARHTYGSLEPTLLHLLCVKPPNVQQRMRLILPKSMAYWKDYLGKREQFLAVRLVLDTGAVDNWKDEVLSSVRRFKSEYQYAQCMAELVPKYCSLEETVARSVPALQVAYYQRLVARARTLTELRHCVAQIPASFLLLSEVCATIIEAYAHFSSVSREEVVAEIRPFVEALVKPSPVHLSPSIAASVMETLLMMGMQTELENLQRSLPLEVLESASRPLSRHFPQRSGATSRSD